ncbi:MAG: hypothetical protein KQI62_03905 [Deltaproteobacteria bacterium]|nr:hypothetical protein [Deltaproteobacteria bacterium]
MRLPSKILIAAVVACCLWPSAVPAGETADFQAQAVYSKAYKDQRWAISPKDFNFLVDNLVGVLAVVSQPEFKRRHPALGNLVLQQLGGTAHAFSLRTYSNHAQVTMERPGPKLIAYRAQIAMHKLGLSVNGQMLVRLHLQYASLQDPELGAEVTVAFRPASQVLAAALKPVMDSFQEEMDRLAGKVMVQIKDFVRIYQQERAGAFSRAGLLSQLALINQRRLVQATELKERSSAPGSALPSGGSGRILLALAAALLLLTGLVLGWLLANRLRASRDQRLLRNSLRAQREQAALDKRLAKLLKSRGISPQAAAGAKQEHQGLSQELLKRLKKAPGKAGQANY